MQRLHSSYSMDVWKLCNHLAFNQDIIIETYLTIIDIDFTVFPCESRNTSADVPVYLITEIRRAIISYCCHEIDLRNLVNRLGSEQNMFSVHSLIQFVTLSRHNHFFYSVTALKLRQLYLTNYTFYPASLFYLPTWTIVGAGWHTAFIYVHITIFSTANITPASYSFRGLSASYSVK